MTIDLSQLDQDQLQAAIAPRGPVAILAGAGTGKTRTITYRIAHLIDQGLISPQRVLAVTFTARAAGEMRDRLRAMGTLGVQARTFHAAARRQLRYFWPQAYGDLPWQLIENKFSLVARAVRAAGLDASTENVRDILGEIEWAKACCFTPYDYVVEIGKTKRTPPVAVEKIQAVYEKYEQTKQSGDTFLLDFDDLLIHTAAILENSPPIAEEFREQYRSFVVDEYQDVTPLQQRLLKAWLGERDDLTIVGDANQTIYSFTGADPAFLLNFSREYPHATVVKLQRDYRSTPQVVELANTVISKAVGRAAGTRLELQGMQKPGPEPEYHAYDDEPTEAREIAGQILTLLKNGVPAREIAVLYRVNAQSAVFEKALSDAGIVYQVRGGEGFFQRPEIRKAIAQIMRASQVGGVPGDDVGEQVRAILAPLGLTSTEPSGTQARERWQLLNALADLADDLAQSNPSLTLAGLLAELQARAESRQPPTVEGVTLASFHAAKGLEWDAVFLVGLVENTLPISFAIKAGDAHIEEERRLFYVGITRARRHLHLSWAYARQEGARSTRKRTRFLDGIVPELSGAEVPERAPRSPRCRVCGRPLLVATERVLGRHEDCPVEMEAAIFDQLRAWRLETARENHVPPYIVFTDATLMAIAETLPQDSAELLEISGVGPVKIEKYGESLLALLNNLRA
ncbi:ATP-dependent DNA helicase UvrD2 [Corynebacterium caspium]|uniref:ATP-dependent DNA helicase UvrD2 n=1 Tax=Corynebacterium caspium TaxID=234828 RepID=UPI000377A9E1|nr:ATP-dependent DNA helicase UvrD2 [Corynebacterium caspium]WKD59688.1 ATP-dependent DNA helicase UvrD2 [Corynebacterium caspium DSM 44850]